MQKKNWFWLKFPTHSKCPKIALAHLFNMIFSAFNFEKGWRKLINTDKHLKRVCF